MDDTQYMRRAIELARMGTGFTNPNPCVGAVIVKDGRIIGEGYHKKCGELHAERNAIASLTEPANGATIYVTLEPCCHYGKTPPCTEAIIENGITRVFVGSKDPNPLVAGKGVNRLREAGIEVIEDFLEDECDELNPVFFHYITSDRPYTVLKYAMTMDGKIATYTGDSQWITGEASREEVHRLRHKYMAIMAGIGTVLTDNPMLNTRLEGLKSPIRVICDTKLRIPVDSAIVQSADVIKTIVAYSTEDATKEAQLEEKGVILKKIKEADGHIDIKELMHELYNMGIDSVLVEGGGILNDSIIRNELADRVEVFIGPKLFGGHDAKTPVEGFGIGKVSESKLFSLKEVKRHGDDVQLSYIRNNREN